MGLFSKEPAEKKAFWKAFDSACSKPGEKTFPALEEACKAWPIGWQGYFLMALAYDLAAGVPFDPAKAAEYHTKAREAAAKAANQWISVFYVYYDENAMNFYVKEDYFPRTMKVRKAGIAMMWSYFVNSNGILGDNGKKDDLKFWQQLFSKINTGGLFKMTDEQQQVYTHLTPFSTWINDYVIFNGGADQNTIIKYTNDVIGKMKKLHKLSNDRISTDFADMWYYTFATSFYAGGRPYQCFGSDWHTNRRVDGWIYYWHAAHRGCLPACYILADYWDDPDFHSEIVYAAGQAINGCGNENSAMMELLTLLEKGLDKGDSKCISLLETLCKE